MSTGTRQPLASALTIALKFRDLFEGTFEEWHVAGSIRRQRPMVGDVEHVVIPKFVPMFEESIFAAKHTGTENAVWKVTNRLIGNGPFQKATYGGSNVFRWGTKLRGVIFEGMKHEIYMADTRNLGALLTIRTGPAEFSERLVTILKQGGLFRQHEGYVRQVRDGEPCMFEDAIVPVPTEEAYLRLCRLPAIPPEKRDAWIATSTGARR